MKNTSKLTKSSITTIGDIYKFLKEYPEYKEKIFVKTRFGFKEIIAADITAKNSQVITISTRCGRKISTSPDHLMLSNNVSWVKTKDLSLGDVLFTEDGPTVISKIKYLKTNKDLYDIQVKDVKEYYANGLVSHNSTLIDSITFALFGKPFRKINKAQLVNSITQKNCVVEIEFSIGTFEYKIIRGIKPNIFEIYKNNNLIEQSAEVKDYQELLEKQILKVNYRSFCQVVILGSANYQPFMQLTAGQRREVIEDLLDLKIFTTMNTLLKDKITDNINKIKEEEANKRLFESKIQMAEEHALDLKINNEKLIEERVEENNETIRKANTLNREYKTLDKRIEEERNKIIDENDITNNISKTSKMIHQLEAKLAVINSDISFFEDHQNCPTCKQEIEEEFRSSSIKDKNKEIRKINNGIDKLKSSLKEYNSRYEEIKTINRSIRDLEMDRATIKQEIKNLVQYSEKLKNEINKLEIKKETEVDTRINEYKESLKTTEREYNKLVNDKEVLAVISTLLKDSGIKSKIIKQYIPVINKFINKYLSAMDFFVSFELDENFNEKIKSRHRDEFTYSSFSEGEKMRIDLALLFTWRSIAKLRNSLNTNLLLFDEVLDSSLDNNAIDFLMNIIRDVAKDSNIFIISHRDNMQEKFPNSIKFKKVKNFSQIEMKA